MPLATLAALGVLANHQVKLGILTLNGKHLEIIVLVSIAALAALAALASPKW